MSRPQRVPGACAWSSSTPSSWRWCSPAAGLIGRKELSWEAVAQAQACAARRRREGRMTALLRTETCHHALRRPGGRLEAASAWRSPRGEIVGLIGPNGAGKTTAFNIITGMHPPTEGRVLFRGEEITGIGATASAQRAVGPHLPEHPPLQGADRPGERAGGVPPPPRHGDAGGHPAPAGLPPPRARGPRLRDGPAETGGSGVGGGRGGHQPPLRQAAAPGDRAGAGHPPVAAPPRRAGGGHEPAGVGGADATSSVASATSSTSPSSSSSTTCRW